MDGPDDGHTFEVCVRMRGSHAVVGEPHTDSEYWDDLGAVVIRAWSLPEAMRKAGALPLTAWPGLSEDTDSDDG